MDVILISNMAIEEAKNLMTTHSDIASLFRCAILYATQLILTNHKKEITAYEFSFLKEIQLQPPEWLTKENIQYNLTLFPIGFFRDTFLRNILIIGNEHGPVFDIFKFILRYDFSIISKQYIVYSSYESRLILLEKDMKQQQDQLTTTQKTLSDKSLEIDKLNHELTDLKNQLQYYKKLYNEEIQLNQKLNKQVAQLTDEINVLEQKLKKKNEKIKNYKLSSQHLEPKQLSPISIPKFTEDKLHKNIVQLKILVQTLQNENILLRQNSIPSLNKYETARPIPEPTSNSLPAKNFPEYFDVKKYHFFI